MGDTMRASSSRTDRWMWLGALMAFLALAMNIVSPQGFMVTSGQAGPTIAICTGHGPATLPGQTDQSGHKGGHEGACAFAGHGVAADPPPVAVFARLRFSPPLLAIVALRDLAPGRGLAAPPPPSQGPPLHLT